MNGFVITRTRCLQIMCVALCLCLAGCSGGSKAKAALRARAEGLGNLLVSIHGMQEAQARQALTGFIEPSPTRAARVAEYYSDFSAKSEKFKIVSHSIKSIKIRSGGSNADVTYQMVAQSPGGTKIPVEQVTQWVLVDGIWYRTIEEAKKKLDR